MALLKTTAPVATQLATLVGASKSLDFRDTYFRHADSRDADERNGTQIRRNVDPPTPDRILPPAKRQGHLYADMEPGDRHSLTCVPGVGTELALMERLWGSSRAKSFRCLSSRLGLGSDPSMEGSAKNYSPPRRLETENLAT